MFSVALSGCSNQKEAKLIYGEKYISCNNASNQKGKQSYVSFNKDGTGEYRYYRESDAYVNGEDYTIHFKYTVTDGIAVCHFNGIDIVNDGYSKPSSYWSQYFIITENTLIDKTNDHYILESYLNDELTNYGK